MIHHDLLNRTPSAISAADVPPYLDLPSARDFVVALGRIYLDAGLPLAAAFEAAFADYRSFNLPIRCDS